MNRYMVAGAALWMAGAGLLAGGGIAQADEIDEILKIERMADQEMLGADSATSVDPDVAPAAMTPSAASAAASEVAAPAPAPKPKAARTAPAAGGSDLAARLRRAEADLARAEGEILRLQQTLVEQDALHQRDMERSYYNMGCVYKASKQFDRAEAEFLKVLAIDPDDAGTHYNLGILYEEDLKRPELARKHYLSFLEVAPDDPDAPTVQEWLDALKKK